MDGAAMMIFQTWFISGAIQKLRELERGSG